jgi:hypothetical protein
VVKRDVEVRKRMGSSRMRRREKKQAVSKRTGECVTHWDDTLVVQDWRG